jgi:hypothetical protein
MGWHQYLALAILVKPVRRNPDSHYQSFHDENVAEPIFIFNNAFTILLF